MKRGRPRTIIEPVQFHIRISKKTDDQLKSIVENQYLGDESSKNALIRTAIREYIKKYYKDLV